MTDRATVVLAGPNQLLQIGVKQVLEASDRFRVVSQVHASELALSRVRQLRRAGCRACVSARSADTVLRAMAMLSAGREYFSEWRNSGPRERARGNSGASTLLKDLNRSEVRILPLMARGYSSKKIAARVHLAVGTVNNYRATIRTKLGAVTHAEIRQAARAAELLGPQDDSDA